MEQTVTIVNNSGKIISTGKQLFSIFKEAKAHYSEKKESVKAERALLRANTFDETKSSQRAPSVRDDNVDFRPRTLSRAHTMYYAEDDQCTLQDQPRRRSYDAASVASSRRSHRSKASHSHVSRHHGSSYRARSTRAPSEASEALSELTEDNLKTHSEAARTRSSRPPTTLSRYRSPYAETVPMGQSNMDLTVVERSVYYPAESSVYYPAESSVYYPANGRQAAMIPRSRSESQLGPLVPQSGALITQPKKKKIDMNLAYGNIPPDLAYRTDLADTDQGEATALVRRVESLLDEANCLQHSAKAMIKHLQEKPEAAAAVALTLSELSAVATKMSPAILGLLKGGSPAVFALLASPQFLIASGLAAGVTVVMFGGWKIVKRVQQERALQAAAFARQQLPPAPDAAMDRAPLQRAHTYAESYDEALVLDDELSTIESWRRGIEPIGDGESADMELITPEADRATRADERERYEDQRDFEDARSHRSSRTHRTSKTVKTSKTHKTHKTHHSSSKRGDDDDRKSSKGSSRDGSSSKSKSRSEVKLPEDGRSSRHRSRDDLDLPVRSKAQRQESDLFKSLFKRKNKDASRSQLVVA
ncbi:hypothetical protein LLEC1_06215 [Akanthomyces lecanii]|uniref:Uncharacterized protein n=1 Tax=Cordyceps confragosa TaxID=2714763 RepID=A0A179IFT8_CORDF|nr:hypothetical protein LLEC1_06215 [Akanthomyces lecanii]